MFTHPGYVDGLAREGKKKKKKKTEGKGGETDGREGARVSIVRCRVRVSVLRGWKSVNCALSCAREWSERVEERQLCVVVCA